MSQYSQLGRTLYRVCLPFRARYSTEFCDFKVKKSARILSFSLSAYSLALLERTTRTNSHEQRRVLCVCPSFLCFGGPPKPLCDNLCLANHTSKPGYTESQFFVRVLVGFFLGMFLGFWASYKRILLYTCSCSSRLLLLWHHVGA